MSSGRMTAAAAVLAALMPAAALGKQAVDIELVLAVDVSGSVDGDEQLLQREGLAAAFRDPAVIEAIGLLPAGVAVALVVWAGVEQERTAVAWRRLTDRASVEDFAARVEAALPASFGAVGYTAIGDALTWSLAELAGNDFEGRAKIDVSGDGHSNCGAYPSQVRDAAVAAGVTINGLAIVNDEPYVAEYYRTNVVGGTDAFVMTADDYQAFVEAIQRKLIRELAPGPTTMC